MSAITSAAPVNNDKLDTTSNAATMDTPSTDGGEPTDTPAEKRGGSDRFELALYLAAAIIYIAVGFVRQEVFAWWIYGAAWFVAVVWFAPPLIKRARKRLRPKTPAERDSA